MIFKPSCQTRGSQLPRLTEREDTVGAVGADISARKDVAGGKFAYDTYSHKLGLETSRAALARWSVIGGISIARAEGSGTLVAGVPILKPALLPWIPYLAVEPPVLEVTVGQLGRALCGKLNLCAIVAAAVCPGHISGEWREPREATGEGSAVKCYLRLLHASPRIGVLAAIFKTVVLALLGRAVEPCHTSPGVDALGGDSLLGRYHVDSPVERAAMLGDIDRERLGEIHATARDIGRHYGFRPSEFDRCDEQTCYRSRLRHIDHYATSGHIDYRCSYLLLDGEVSLYILHSRNGPYVILIERQHCGERSRHVDAVEIGGRVGPHAVGGIKTESVDHYVVYVGLFGKIHRDGASYGVNHRVAL